MAQKKRIVDVFKIILGKSVSLGSFAARTVNPGDKSQLPHVDYPYFDMHKIEKYPQNINFSFLMNCQWIWIKLDTICKPQVSRTPCIQDP